ncbi:MAG: PQQ-binding-like beta-propeller repeat protein [Vulcanimicrobiota bacterium]
MRYLVLLLFIFILCTSMVAAEPAAPPFRKIWSFKAKGQIFSTIHNNIITDKILCYYTFDDEYGAVDIATGRCLWKKSAEKNHIRYARCHNGRFHVVIENKCSDTKQYNTGNGALHIIDPYTGNEIRQMPINGMSCYPEIEDGIFYCLFKGSVLTAIDIETKKRIWTRDISLNSGDYDDTFCQIGLKAEGKHLFVKKRNKELLCIDRISGESRWVVSFSDSYPSYVVDSKRVYLSQHNEITALDVQNGRKEWTFHIERKIPTPVASTEDLLIFVGKDNILYAINTENGRLSWSLPLPLSKFLPSSSLSIVDETVLLSWDQRILAFSLKGQKLWEFDGKVHDYDEIEAFGRGYLFIDNNVVLRYEEGKPPEPPDTVEGRKALAEKLVSRFDELDDEEQYTLGTLGDQAFDALLPLVKKFLATSEKVAAEKESQYKDPQLREIYISEYYCGFDHAIHALDKVTTGKHTSQLFSLLSTARKTHTRMRILNLLSKKGDEAVTIPYFIKEIERIGDGDDRAFYTALYDLGESENPAAVDFLIGKLGDEKASQRIRDIAYINLGRTGGEKGARAVLKARDETRTIPSLESFAEFDRLDMSVQKETERDPDNQLIKVMRGRDNRLWGLAQSYILGSFWDIWILESDGNKWKRAFFAGKTIKDMSDIDGDCLTEFTGNTSVSKDSDSDGWTDEVEKRLGTDPQNKDTDGDGLIDSTDKNPLAAPRALSEEEKIMRAAFEARYCFSCGDGYKTPCLVKLPEGIQPFEFYGFNWIIIPEVHGKESPLSKCVETILRRGVGVVSFDLPRRDFEGYELPDRKGRDFILWNSDRSEAMLSLSTRYGPLNAAGYDIHVRKLGDEWIVIKITRTWVS